MHVVCRRIEARFQARDAFLTQERSTCRRRLGSTTALSILRLDRRVASTLSFLDQAHAQRSRCHSSPRATDVSLAAGGLRPESCRMRDHQAVPYRLIEMKSAIRHEQGCRQASNEAAYHWDAPTSASIPHVDGIACLTAAVYPSWPTSRRHCTRDSPNEANNRHSCNAPATGRVKAQGSMADESD